MKIIAAILTLTAICAASMAAVPEPLALPNRAIGGGAFNQYTPGVADGAGLNNIGLLVKTWGRVTAPANTTDKYFYIDDGAKLNDTSGYTGLRVSYANLAAGNTITPPTEGQWVVIIGISSTTDLSGRIVPTLRPRRQADISVVPPP